jgi:hypothetical protein
MPPRLKTTVILKLMIQRNLQAPQYQSTLQHMDYIEELLQQPEVTFQHCEREDMLSLQSQEL